MTAAYDNLRLPGTEQKQLNFYIGLKSGLSTDTNLTIHPEYAEIYNFCRENKNGRTWGTTPWYQWPFSGPGEAGFGKLHTGPYGTVRHGEFEGYAKFVVEDEGLGKFFPLWKSVSRPIKLVTNSTIVVPFDRPSGVAFRNSELVWQWDTLDGIAKAHQYGWRVRKNGKFVDTDPVISGLDVYLRCNLGFRTGDKIEISYAMYGGGGKNPGLHAGVYGNLTMRGPQSAFFLGKSLNAWAWQFAEIITV